MSLLKKRGFCVTNGWEWGIRTPDAGFRVRSLTAWRIPKIDEQPYATVQMDYYARGIVSKGIFFANLFFGD